MLSKGNLAPGTAFGGKMAVPFMGGDDTRVCACDLATCDVVISIQKTAHLRDI